MQVLGSVITVVLGSPTTAVPGSLTTVLLNSVFKIFVISAGEGAAGFSITLAF